MASNPAYVPFTFVLAAALIALLGIGWAQRKKRLGRGVLIVSPLAAAFLLLYFWHIPFHDAARSVLAPSRSYSCELDGDGSRTLEPFTIPLPKRTVFKGKTNACSPFYRTYATNDRRAREVKIIDLSHRIQDGMPPYPGDTETTLVHSKVYERDFYNNHQLTINMHAGTHIDGPMHLLDRKEYLSEIPLETFIGEGVVIDVSGGMKEIAYKEEYEERIKNNQIVLLYTGFGSRFGQPGYFSDHPVLTMEFAQLIVKKQIKMIGLDMPSPDRDPFEIHKCLFENRILIAENLTNLDQLLHVPAFEVIALPLSIRADSSIARIIARI